MSRTIRGALLWALIITWSWLGVIGIVALVGWLT